MSVDLARLRTPEAREVFYHEAFSEGQVIDHLVDYYNASREAMVECGAFDEQEAAKEAADAACSGLAASLRNLRNTRYLLQIDELDSLIRTVHGIQLAVYPRKHPDPLVEAFYVNLEPHLRKAQAGDRIDTWQS